MRGRLTMATPNFANRTLYHGDNLPFLRGINSGTIHLIATDPPFNKGRDFHATPDSLAAGARFGDEAEAGHQSAGPTLSRAEMVDILLEENGMACAGCDREFDDPLYLQLDHKTPRSEGGLNHISNRMLLCGRATLSSRPPNLERIAVGEPQARAHGDERRMTVSSETENVPDDTARMDAYVTLSEGILDRAVQTSPVSAARVRDSRKCEARATSSAGRRRT